MIKNYYNLYFKRRFLKEKYISHLFRKKRNSLQKIYVSKAEVKHTNSKALINIFIYNKEKMALLENIKIFSILKLILAKKSKKEKLQILGEIIIKMLWPRHRHKKIKEFKNKLLLFLNKFKKSQKMSISFRKLKLKFSLNKYKFERILLYRLGIYLKKIYKKRIEFNIINLKSINFNIDMLTGILTLSIRRKKKNVSPNAGWLSYRLQRRVKFPIVNNIIERMYEGKNKDMSLIENNYKNLNINSLLIDNIFDPSTTVSTLSSSDLFTSNEMKEVEKTKFRAARPKNSIEGKDILNESLSKFYKGLNLNKKKEDYKNINEIIFQNIKYKNMGGIKFEINGRLTRRYRADRALHIRRLLGGLNNIDSSFKRKSAVVLRGYVNSNVDSAIFTSKRRIGAFAVKGWMSGRYYSTRANRQTN